MQIYFFKEEIIETYGLERLKIYFIHNKESFVWYENR